MTDQELKSAWLDTRSRLDRIEKSIDINSHNSFDFNRKTSLDNLIRRYRTFSCLGLAMAVYSCCWKLVITEPQFNKLLPIIMAVYFITAAFMDRHLMCGLMKINLNTMSVTSVCFLVAKYKRLHHIYMSVLIPFALIVVGIIAGSFIDNAYMIAGIATGLILGLAIGVRQYFKIMKDYKILSED